jgi:uncharacterized protein (DUF58 family)
MRTTAFSHFWQPRYLKPATLIGLTIVAYIAAINRMQTMPWAIASLLLATLLIGYTWPRWLIRHLAVTRSGPMRAKEGDSINFHVEVRNHGWLPRFMVEAVDHLPFVGAADSDRPVSEKVLGVVAYIAGGATRQFEVALHCEKRGFYQLGPTGLATSFPLGLAEARQKKNGGVQSLTIYPDIFPIVALPLLGTPSEINRGSFLLTQGAGSAEFCGLREYRRGDSPRHIHWPTTARLNELMVKEFEPLASASLYLALDYSRIANAGTGKHSCFEYAVRIAASIARYACNNNMPIRLAGDSSNRFHIGLATGDAHFRDMLDTMAIADAADTTPYSRTLQTVAMNCRHGQTVFIFLSEPEAFIAETLQAVALLRARGAHIFAITFDRDTFQDKPAQPHSPWGGLFDIGIPFMTIRKGDDLMRLFNP